MSAPTESFYTSSPISPTGPPPPPPPKPTGHITSNDASRSGTPTYPPAQYAGQSTQYPPQAQQYNPTTSPPPPPVPPNPSSYTSAQQNAYTPQQQQYNPSQQQPLQSPPPQHQYRPLPQPPIPQNYLPPTSPPLPTYSIPDLTALLTSQAAITHLAQQNPSHTSTTLTPLNQLLSQNIQLAQQLSSLEAQLRSERDKTAQLMLNHTSLQQQWRRKQSEMDNALSPWQPRAMYQRLVASIAEQEALLRAIHESFLDGDGAGRGGSNGDEDGYGGGSRSGSGKASDREVAEWIRRVREGTTTLERRRELKNRWDEGRVSGFR